MTQIQLRRDTAANWASANPTLASGEPAFETDTGKFKIGDGVTAYNSLPYKGEGSAGVDDYEDLTSKPQINSITLEGNKTATDLGLATVEDIANLDTNKQNKLTAGAGLSLTDNEISIDTQTYKGLVYSNNDTTFGTIDYSSGVYNQKTVIKYPTVKDGLGVVAFDGNINNITSFDYMTVVKVTDFSNHNGVVMFAGNAAYNYVSIDCWNEQYLRAVCYVNGWTETEESIIYAYNNFVALRIQHTGTTLNVFTYVSPNGELPSNDEDWALKYTKEWDLSQNPISGDNLYLFVLGGSLFFDSTLKTTNTIGGAYFLNQTVLTINDINVFNKLSDANSVIASEDKLGLVKIDNDTIVLNNNSQLKVSDTITKQGNTFNGANQLVQLDSSGKLPAVDGSQLTNLPVGNPSDAYSVTTLNSNIDLNTLTTEGLYFVDGGSNFPSNASSTRGFVSVEKLNYPQWGAVNGSLVQTFTTINSLSTSTPPDIYTRFRTTITFSPWVKVNGGEVPSNMVTTDTNQTITGTKTFDNDTVFNGRIRMDNDRQTALDLTVSNRITVGASNASNLNQIFLNANEVRVSSGNLTNAQNSHIIQKTDTTITIGDSGDTIVNGNNKKVLDEENFATLAPTGNLKYWTGTEAAYTELTTKDADTLYRTTDTNKVYLGTIQIGGNA